MKFDEFKILAKGMKAVYTGERFLPDGDSLKIWYQMLQDLDYKAASTAIQKYMQTNKFPPTIADIREQAAIIINGDKPEWSKGWEQVLKAISLFGMYDIGGALESMDEITRQAVKRLGFKELCLSENPMADRANFRTIFEQIAVQNQANKQLSEGVKHDVEQIQGSMIKFLGGEHE